MSSNCLFSLFACCNSRKRAILPSDSTLYQNFLQNASTQTPFRLNPNISLSGSLPALSSSVKVSHKPTIMVKRGTTFEEQLSEELLRSSINRKSSINSSETSQQFIQQAPLPVPFVMQRGKSLPRLTPVTPRQTVRGRNRLPTLPRSNVKENYIGNNDVNNENEYSLNRSEYVN